MPGATRVGTDSAGGPLATGSGNVFVNNVPAVRVGDKVSPHGKPPHNSPVMTGGSSNVFVNGIPEIKAGDKATCGHPSSGSGDVFVNG